MTQKPEVRSQNNFIYLLTSCVILCFMGAIPSYAFSAEIELQISKQAGRKIDMAVAPLLNPDGSGNSVSAAFDQALSSDLALSGYFELVNEVKEIQALSATEPPNAIIQNSRWKGLGAEILVKGSFALSGQTGSMEVYAFEIAGGRRIFGKKYSCNESTVRSTAHTCSNDLIYQLTGEHGISGTRIAYVAGNSQSKEVFVSDPDGKNVRQLTRDGSIILGISWHPSGQKLLYTSFKGGMPRIYIQDIIQGQRQRLAAYPGLNAAAKFSPDGSRVTMVLSKDGNPEIYVSDLEGRNLRRMTNHPGIDACPTWSPDGKKIAFVSDRTGRPDIYSLDLQSGKLTRLTSQGAYNSSPSWSPKGDKIAYSSVLGGGSKICILDLIDETFTIVSHEGGDAEEPDWAPDGRHIVYSSKLGGVNQLFVVDIFDGKTLRLSSGNVNYLTPAWSK